jgi:arylsulfatase A-like enzyme
LAALLASGCFEGGGGAAKNLLLISLDTTRADHLSLYGYEHVTSPRIDAVAAAGHRFDAAYSVMPSTLPAHAAMFTSLHPRELGVRGNGMPVPSTAYTLAERLVEQGFATAAFVSAVPLHARLGLDQGFQHYDEPPVKRPGNETRTRALDWLRRQGEGRFFLFVHLYDPHTWYEAPESARTRFGAPGGRQPPARDFLRDASDLSPAMRKDAIAAYDAEIHFADAQVGALLDGLEALELREDTLVVVTSDHGETLDELIDPYGYAFDHGEFLHGRELRIPLVMSLPPALDLPASGVHDTLVSLLDLMPTFLELLGLPCTAPCLGRSLVPLLDGEGISPQPVYAERRRLTEEERRAPPSPWLQGDEMSVTSEDWHFVEAGGRPPELFDRLGDPQETRNLAAARPEVVARMQRLIDAWRASHALAEASGVPVDPEVLEALRSLGYATEGDAP